MVTLEIKRMQSKPFNGVIKREHYLHRAHGAQSLYYGIYCNKQLMSLLQFSVIYKPILLRFPFLQWFEIADNSRFLIRKEWDLFERDIEIYCLGSRSLSLGIKQVRQDWYQLTGYKLKLIITYIDLSRGLTGTVYKAANWIQIEDSAGKNYNKKNKIDYKPSPKKTLIYPLIKGDEWRPVTYFDKEYLRKNWHKMNSVAQYNYKPKGKETRWV